jgi:hypothetical protein
MRADICSEQEPELRPVNFLPAKGTAAAVDGSPDGDAWRNNGSHLSACHFADQVASMSVGSMFSDTSADQEVLPS